MQDLANQFQLTRVGSQHQAGSDSYLTGVLFFRLRDDIFQGKLEEFTGKLFGLTGSFGDRVHHLENVLIKENVNRSSNSASSPISSAVASQAVPVEGNSNSDAEDKSERRATAVNTFTVLTNVNIPDRFESAGYFR